MNKIVVLICFCIACFNYVVGQDTPEELREPDIKLSPAYGLGYEEGVRRQDPSNVIKVDSVYYVWYSKAVKGEMPPGKELMAVYGSIFYATSKDGKHWTERGESLQKGEITEWDGKGVLTPYVMDYNGEYYMYYRGSFHDSQNKPEVFIGLAIAEYPEGPWEKYENNPVLSPSRDTAAFDQFLVDDANVIGRDGKFWLYYKGRNEDVSPYKTAWGLAIAENPEGPFIKYENNPVLNSGHCVLAWPFKEGVAMLVDLGPEANTIQYSADGYNFKRAGYLEIQVREGGAYCPDAFDNTEYGRGIQWGIAADPFMRPPERWLIRFECDLYKYEK